jgi:hypothetical protein
MAINVNPAWFWNGAGCVTLSRGRAPAIRSTSALPKVSSLDLEDPAQVSRSAINCSRVGGGMKERVAWAAHACPPSASGFPARRRLFRRASGGHRR